MKSQTRLIMGMEVTVSVAGRAPDGAISRIFEHFLALDARFSPFKICSEVTRYDRFDLRPMDLSEDMQEVLDLAALTTRQSHGYFRLRSRGDRFDPSGIVKGWAIERAACQLRAEGIGNFYIDAGGDIQTAGRNANGEPWRIGIRNPFNSEEIVKIVALSGQGIATSGSYVQGNHIYDPHRPGKPIPDVVSVTVIADDILEADRFATASFAMGSDAVHFIEEMPNLEGYVIDAGGVATMTSGFRAFEQV